MLNQLQLQWIIWKAGQSVEQGGNLDINLAASGLKQAAEKFLALLQMPDCRPIQERYDFLMATAGKQW